MDREGMQKKNPLPIRNVSRGLKWLMLDRVDVTHPGFKLSDGQWIAITIDMMIAVIVNDIDVNPILTIALIFRPIINTIIQQLNDYVLQVWILQISLIR